MSALLMAKLLEIERSAGYVDPLMIRRLAMEAQELLLDLQREQAAGLSAKIGAQSERGDPEQGRRPPLAKWPGVSRLLKLVNPAEPRTAPEEPVLAGR
jgi:hypothetical protein